MLVSCGAPCRWIGGAGVAATGGMQGGPQPETHTFEMDTFILMPTHCCATLKSLSAEHRQRCDERWWLWECGGVGRRGGPHTCEQSKCTG